MKHPQRISILALFLMCIGATKLHAQSTITSKDQFTSIVRKVYVDLPSGIGDSVARANMVRSRIISPSLSITDKCMVQLIEAWRGTLDTNLSALSVNRNQLAGYLEGVDMALATETRKGSAGPCTPAIPARQLSVAGPQGLRGPQGPKGDTGPQGPQGPRGPAAEKEHHSFLHNVLPYAIVAAVVGSVVTCALKCGGHDEPPAQNENNSTNINTLGGNVMQSRTLFQLSVGGGQLHFGRGN